MGSSDCWLVEYFSGSDGTKVCGDESHDIRRAGKCFQQSLLEPEALWANRGSASHQLIFVLENSKGDPQYDIEPFDRFLEGRCVGNRHDTSIDI